MTRFTKAAVVVALAATVGVIAPLPSCKGLPNKTCFGERVNAMRVDGGNAIMVDPPPPLDARCTTCLQSECCDEVGVCQEDEACVKDFRTAHECVLSKGPGEESTCISLLQGPTTRGRHLYDCMRGHCGGTVAREAPCGVSNCDVDKSVIQLGNPTCDRCLGGSCCREVNACYQDRRCKLALECIVRDCGTTIGRDMNLLRAAGPVVIERTRVSVCSGQDLSPEAGSPVPEGQDPVSLCIQTCLEAFAPVIGGTADDQSARCLAFDVFACGSSSNCGDVCGASADGGVGDASTD